MAFFYTSEHLAKQLAEAENRAARLRVAVWEAKVREFYFHIVNGGDAVGDDEWEKFTNSPWTVSFMVKTVELENSADLYAGFVGLLRDYMDEALATNPAVYPDDEVLKNGTSYAFLPEEITRYVENLFMQVRID